MKNTRKFDRRLLEIAIDIQMELPINIEAYKEDMRTYPFEVIEADKDILLAHIADRLGVPIIKNSIKINKKYYYADEYLMTILTSARALLKGDKDKVEVL